VVAVVVVCEHMRHWQHGSLLCGSRSYRRIGGHGHKYAKNGNSCLVFTMFSATTFSCLHLMVDDVVAG
jgi:hypothetical protein